jgi:uncharacterized lipoprotein YddW (UPF0748 family)
LGWIWAGRDRASFTNTLFFTAQTSGVRTGILAGFDVSKLYFTASFDSFSMKFFGFKRLTALSAAALLAMLAGCAGNTGPTISQPGETQPGKPPAVVSSTAASTPAVPAATGGSLHEPPPAPREVRAVWVASVGNIDWPSRKNLSSAQQQTEMLAILNTAAAMHLNAIVLQVRPSADALYASPLEPWSEYLTGEQGRPPKPYYDPLQMWVEEAHKRGLELHAWFNPYRARSQLSSKAPLASNHISRTHPEVVKQYGDMLWMDPGEPVSEQQTLAVICDVVKRYDIDGVQIDDYFYPYPAGEKGAEQEFPDDESWQRYQKEGGTLTRADWRRQNVNRLIEQINSGVHKEKSWIKFGISPFGIGRPDRQPPGIVGFSQYDKLHADVELWLQNGWLDYLAPQLYWPLDQAPQAYKVLLDYWIKQNSKGRQIWPGLFTSKLNNGDAAWTAQEILNQIDATRERPEAGGHIHFSMATLMRNRQQIRSLLQEGPYASPALVPAMPWLGSQAPAAPTLDKAMGGINANTGADARLLAIWKRYDLLWRFSVQPASQSFISLADDPAYGVVQEVQVSAIGRTGTESARSVWSVAQ